MALETGAFVSDLVTSNPVGSTDAKSQGDDHIRLLKSVLKSTFPDASRAFKFEKTLSKTAAYTTVLGDDRTLILCDATTAAFTVTLLAAATAKDGHVLAFKKTDSSANAVTIDGAGAETIDGATTLVLSSQYDAALLYCDGSNWHILVQVGVPSARKIDTGAGLSGGGDLSADRTHTLDAASETAVGGAELATQAETHTGTDDTRIVTPLKARFTKGADIASADPLVLGTDGRYFNVTGTTNFASITVAIGRFFVLQFNGILTLTHNATTLDLPSEANITTAAGDSMMCFATAANQVHVISYTRADGSAVGGTVRVLQSLVMSITTTTGTTTIPDDDTAPLSSEGTEVSSQAITMADNSNTVRVRGTFFWSTNTNAIDLVVSCYRGSTIVGTIRVRTQGADVGDIISVSWDDSPATAGSVTYSIRVGLNSAGTWRTNQMAVARFSGNLANSRIILEEIEA